MKVLQICNKPPLPAIDGGCLAMHQLGTGLLDSGIDLTIISICTNKHPFEKEKLDQDYIERTKSEFIYVDTDINVVDAFSSLITKDSYNITRFFSPDLDQKIEYILKRKKFDCIILESVFVAPYIDTIRRESKAKLVLRAHNIEYKIWKRMSKQAGKGPKKLYYKHLAKRLKEFEISVWNQVDGIATISTEDKIYLNKKVNTPVVNIPFGINMEDYQSDYNTSNSVFHLGSLDWKPNLEGVSWFIDEVIPLVKSEMKFHVAGRNIPSWLGKMNQDKVEIVGEVESARKFISAQGIMIVPLLSGGGMRVKIIEGMALSKPVITTSIGAEGIDANHNEHVLIADTAEEFAAQLDRLINDENLRKRLALNSRALIAEKYDRQIIIKKLIEFIELI